MRRSASPKLSRPSSLERQDYEEKRGAKAKCGVGQASKVSRAVRIAILRSAVLSVCGRSRPENRNAVEALLFAMWSAMMMPSAAPMLLQYARTVRSNPEATRTVTRVYAFAGGYIFLYTLFSLVATIIQRVITKGLCDARKFIFQVRSLTSLSPSLPTWHLPQTLDLTCPAGGTA